MRLGTVLTTLAAATLVVAQPALAATRSASSLPAVGAKVFSVEGRTGSRLGTSEELVGLGFIWIIAIAGVLAVLGLVVADENSFDDIDDLPDSP